MAPSISMVIFHQGVLYHPPVSSSSSLHSAQTVLLLFLSYVSTTHLLIVSGTCLAKTFGYGQGLSGIFCPAITL